MKFKMSLLGLLMPYLLLAQTDYALFPVDSLIHSNGNFEFPSVQMDLVNNGNYTYQFLHPTYNRDFQDPTESYADILDLATSSWSWCIDWGLEHWLGSDLRYDSTGTYYFNNRMGTPIVLNAKAAVNTDLDLMLYEFGDWDMLNATVDSIVWGSFEDITDSIKYFTLTRLDSNYNTVLDPINGQQILISKNHGLLQSPAFYDFPYKQEIMKYTMKHGADTNLINSNRYKVFNMEVGDAFHTWWKIGVMDPYLKDHKRQITITSKDWSQAEQRFIYGKHIKHKKTFDAWAQDENGDYYNYDEIEISETDEIDTIYLTDYKFLDELLFGIKRREFMQTDTTMDLGFMGMSRGKYNFNDSLFKISLESHHFFNSTIGLKWCESTQSSTGEPGYFVEGCGGVFQDVFHEVTGGYQYELTYIKKGDYIWGEPYNIGLEEYAQNNFKLYPNPSTGWVHIHLDQAAEGSLKLLDLTGRCLMQLTSNTEQSKYTMDLSEFSSGIYFIEYYASGKRPIAERIILK